MRWDVHQAAVVATAHDEGSVAVVARAGAGKTEITRAWIDALGMSTPVLATSFSASAVKTLVERLTPGSAMSVTINALAFSWVRWAWPYIRFDKTKLWRHTDAACLEARKYARGRQTVDRQWSSRVAKLVSFAKNALASSREELAVIARKLHLDSVGVRDPVSAEELAVIAERVMETTLIDTATCDFDDQIWFAVRYGLGPGQPFSVICLDEAQNTSAAQIWVLARALADSGRMFVCGDDMQTLYTWRSADADSLGKFVAGLGAQVKPMSYSHRCPKAVVALAKRIVPDFDAPEDAPEGVVDELTWRKMIENAGPGDFILGRYFAQIARAAFELVRNGVSVTVSGKDYGRDLRALAERAKTREKHGLISWLETYLDRETRGLLEGGREMQIRDLDDRVTTLIQFVDETADWDDLMLHLDRLFSDDDMRDCVTCSTVHAAQSKERGVVWQIDWTPRERDDVKEERKVRYVAQTRASAALHIIEGSNGRDYSSRTRATVDHYRKTVEGRPI